MTVKDESALRSLMFALSFMTALVSPAWAQSYPGTPQEQQACRSDAARFCRGITDSSVVRACLVSHRHQLTARCRRVLQRHGY
jgi:hypothetical protein